MHAPPSTSSQHNRMHASSATQTHDVIDLAEGLLSDDSEENYA
jgi:hypothetical protein